MAHLWVRLPEGYPPDESVSVTAELPTWPIYHHECGMGRVTVDLADGYGNFSCRGCGWRERVPLATQDAPTDRHNVAAFERLARYQEPQSLRLQTIMGGFEGLAIAALLGGALRVTISPLSAQEDG